ncbi:MAG: OsmC family protein [Deltaproteobacteria bacterium]|nr:OsmC family protein [Deltaproteobacteria bacterium]
MADILTTGVVWKDGLVFEAGFEKAKPVAITGKKELDKTAGAWSPVHMLVAAAEDCFALTFFKMAEKFHVKVTSYRSEAKATLDAPDGKHFAITSITINPKIGLENEADRPKLQSIFEKVEEYCPVGNTLKVKIVAIV